MLACLLLYVVVFTSTLSNMEVKTAGLWIAFWLLIAGCWSCTQQVKGRNLCATTVTQPCNRGLKVMYQTNHEFTTKDDDLVRSCTSSPLSFARKGSRLRIISIPEGRGRTQLIRLGIMTGEVVQCIERLPGGTIVIEKNRQEIAIGASLAKTIIVDSAGAGEGSQSPG
jgi:Fe2+ transport system protein FeoA